jgi:hypothetical protein
MHGPLQLYSAVVTGQVMRDEDWAPVSAAFHGPGGITGMDVCERKVRKCAIASVLCGTLLRVRTA